VSKAERDQRQAEMRARKIEFDLIVESIQDIRTRGLLKEELVKPNDGPDGEAAEAETGVPTPGPGEPTDSSTVVNSHLNPLAKAFQPALGGITPRSGTNSRPPTPKPGGPSSNLVVPLFSQSNGSRSGRSTPIPPQDASPLRKADDDDIEMGELAEDKPPSQASPEGRKRPPREDLEEGEASDGDSVLTELPEEYQA